MIPPPTRPDLSALVTRVDAWLAMNLGQISVPHWATPLQLLKECRDALAALQAREPAQEESDGVMRPPVKKVMMQRPVVTPVRATPRPIREEAREPASAWQPMATAPKEGQIDLWAKRWLPAFDRFGYQRFADCSWRAGDSMTNRAPYWLGLGKGWFPTHWMPKPSPPSSQEPDK